MDLKLNENRKNLINQKEGAKKAALKFIIENFQRPEELDNLENVRRRILVQKETADSKLKSSIRHHVNGIRGGLNDLAEASQYIKNLNECLDIIHLKCIEYKELQPKLLDVRLSAKNMCIMNKSVDLLNQLFKIPETIEDTKVKIIYGNLLEAHKNIRELENIRDYLYMEHKRNQFAEVSRSSVVNNPEDWPLAKYFGEVAILSRTLIEKVVENLEQCFELCKSNPEKVVTALRIVEREELVDQYWLDERDKNCGFMPQQRPMECKKMVYNSLRNKVNKEILHIIEVSPKEDKFHTTKLLESFRVHVIDSLFYIKQHLKPCFPLHYDCLTLFATYYHNMIKKQIEILVDMWKENSEINNSISVLIWTRDYYGPSFFGHPEIKNEITFSAIEENPILPEKLRNKLLDLYVTSMNSIMTDWVKRMVIIESKEWRSSKNKPEIYNEQFQTLLPTSLSQMLLPNLESAGTFSLEIKIRVFEGCLSSLVILLEEYKRSFEVYSYEHFHAQKLLQQNEADLVLNTILPHSEDGWNFFTEYCMAIANNSNQIMNITDLFYSRLKKDAKLDIDSCMEFVEDEKLLGGENTDKILKITEQVNKLANLCCETIIKDFMKTMQPAFDNLFGKNWTLNYVSWTNAFFEALEDFHSIMKNIFSSLRVKILIQIDKLVAIEYLNALCSGRLRLTFTADSKEDKRSLVDHLANDARKLTDFFKEKTSIEEEEEISCYSVILCVELIRVVDVSFVRFDLNKLSQLYGDFTEMHAFCILSLRKDITKEAIRNKIKEIDFVQNSKNKAKGVFKNVIIPKNDFISQLLK